MTYFLNKKHFFLRLGFTLVMFVFGSCTGLNFRSWPLPLAPNTHPSKSYAEGGVFFKGGIFYHKDFHISYTGEASIEKSGRACCHSFLYLVAFGSSRIYDAKVDGGIQSIAMIEEEILAILGGFFHRHCTIVYGEAK